MKKMGTILTCVALLLISAMMAGCSEEPRCGPHDAYPYNPTCPSPTPTPASAYTVVPTPAPVETLITHLDFNHSVNITDYVNLPGRGTYRVLVRSYAPETEAMVQLQYQSLISEDKFGTKVYGGPCNRSEYYYGSSCQRETFGYYSYDLSPVNRFSDSSQTILVPGFGMYDPCSELRFHRINCSVDHIPQDTRNHRLAITTVHPGRITVDVWKVA